MGKGLDVEEAALSGLRSLRRLVTVLVGRTAPATLLGWVWLTVDPDGEPPGTTSVDRLRQAF